MFHDPVWELQRKSAEWRHRQDRRVSEWEKSANLIVSYLTGPAWALPLAQSVAGAGAWALPLPWSGFGLSNGLSRIIVRSY